MMHVVELPCQGTASVGGGTKGEHGQAMVEFVVILPVLLLIISSIYGLGMTFRDYAETVTAARDAARIASVSRTDPKAQTSATAAAKAGAQELVASDIVVTYSPGPPWTAGEWVTVTVTYPWSVSIIGQDVRNGQFRVVEKTEIQ
jgi:Flp pilus assembly protein TadG